MNSDKRTGFSSIVASTISLLFPDDDGPPAGVAQDARKPQASNNATIVVNADLFIRINL